MKLFYSMIAGLLLCGALRPAAAHHSAAMWDLTREASYSGTVVKFEWTNPHAWLHLAVPQQDGTTKVFDFESSSPAALRRSMLSWDSIKAGDKVTVRVSPAKDGSQTGFLDSVTWADGRRWVVSRLASPRPDAPKEPLAPQ